MAKTAITFGIILTLLGLIAYFGISSESITALIPAFFGVSMIILGWLALNEKYRKHSMHIAAALMLLGFIGTGIRVFPQLFGEVANPSAFTVQLIMTLLCLIFGSLVKTQKSCDFPRKPSNSIAQNRELDGKYSDERSEKRTLSVRPD